MGCWLIDVFESPNVLNFFPPLVQRDWILHPGQVSERRVGLDGRRNSVDLFVVRYLKGTLVFQRHRKSPYEREIQT